MNSENTPSVTQRILRETRPKEHSQSGQHVSSSPPPPADESHLMSQSESGLQSCSFCDLWEPPKILLAGCVRPP